MDKYKLQLEIYKAAHNRGWTREQLALLAWFEGAKDFGLGEFWRAKLEKILARIETGKKPRLSDAYDELCKCRCWRADDHEANCAWVAFCKLFEMEV